MYIEQTKRKQTQTFRFVDSGWSVTKVIFNSTRPDGGLHPEDRNNILKKTTYEKKPKKIEQKIKRSRKGRKKNYILYLLIK